MKFDAAVLVELGVDDVTFLNSIYNTGSFFAGRFGGVDEFIIVDFEAARAERRESV